MKTLPKTIKVELAETDIRLGVAANSVKCPIARALRRAVGRGTAVSVKGSKYVYIGSDTYLIPKKAVTFINRFDTSYYMRGKERSDFKASLKPISFVARLQA